MYADNAGKLIVLEGRIKIKYVDAYACKNRCKLTGKL